MTTDLTTTGTDLGAQIEFARMVTMQPERANGVGQSILPESYRGNPANVLIAVGLGSAMGLSYAESLYRIAVIKGKPSAAAELIASNVRKAGHKLRVKVTEQPPSATCTIIRADDPDEPTVISRDMAWANRMGLANEPNYKKQPATMLSYRAITACARLACPEALYGVTYTPDEAYDLPAETATPTATGSDFGAPAATTVNPAADVGALMNNDVEDADVVPEDAQAFPAEQNRLNAMFAEFTRAGFTTDARSAEGRQARLGYCSNVTGREITSSKDMTAGEVERVIDSLKVDAAEAGEQA